MCAVPVSDCMGSRIMNPYFHPPYTHSHTHTYTYSEISRNDDQLTELKMYKKFLDSLAPQVSSDQHHTNQQTRQLLTSPPTQTITSPLLPHKPLPLPSSHTNHYFSSPPTQTITSPLLPHQPLPLPSSHTNHYLSSPPTQTIISPLLPHQPLPLLSSHTNPYLSSPPTQTVITQEWRDAKLHAKVSTLKQ